MSDIKGFGGQYRWLSNFYPCKIEWQNGIYQSVEHAYQAAKCDDIEDRKRFQEEANILAVDAKKLGSKVKLRKDWNEEVRLKTMEELLRLKFAHPSFKQKLLDTNDCYIEETNYWGDTFWGVCNNEGTNYLGKLIMIIRKDLCAR